MKISEPDKNLIDGSKFRIAIIVSKFNKSITGGLLDGAKAALKKLSVKEKNIKIFYVPGAFEVPFALKYLCESKSKNKFDGIITLGCIIKGETAHFEYISGVVSKNIQNISLQFNIPVGFGVLTCYTPEQAVQRSIGKFPSSENNKGFESAIAVMEMIKLFKK
jgi:6,7-dimethyl-8-ribityllumazine synthase